MMNGFCKVFENEKKEQLLLLKEYDSITDRYEIQFIFEFDGASGKATIGNINTEESADKIISYWTQERAEEFLKDPLQYINLLIKIKNEILNQ